MSIATIVTRGYGSFGTIADVTRAGYEAAAGAGEVITPPVVSTIQIGDGGIPWQDFVTAEFRRKNLNKDLFQEEKKLEKVEKQIVQARKKLKSQKKSEHPEGILANLFRLEFRKDEIENKIQAYKAELIPLEHFLRAEIDDDDQEFMSMLS